MPVQCCLTPLPPEKKKKKISGTTRKRLREINIATNELKGNMLFLLTKTTDCQSGFQKHSVYLLVQLFLLARKVLAHGQQFPSQEKPHKHWTRILDTVTASVCQLSQVAYTRRLFIGMLSENVVWNIIIEEFLTPPEPEDTRLDQTSTAQLGCSPELGMHCGEFQGAFLLQEKYCQWRV